MKQLGAGRLIRPVVNVNKEGKSLAVASFDTTATLCPNSRTSRLSMLGRGMFLVGRYSINGDNGEGGSY